MNQQSDSEIEVGLGLSRKWNAREAGREVADTAIRRLSRPPDFFLLFSTIHFEKDGGFQEFLNGVWDVLPKGTPLVGGTVVGFMNNHGCYTRGASGLAVSSSQMDVVLGCGRNVKRNPKRAAQQSISMIKKGLATSPYKNKFLLNLVSGPELMKIPGQGYKKVIDSGFISSFATLTFGMSQYLLQKGLGREDEIFEEMVKKLPEYHMILGTSMDDYKGMSNYQFFNETILTNAVVNLGLATNLDLNVCTTHGMKETDKKFTITKLSKDRHIIHEINHRPAVPELLRLLEWPNGFLNEKTMAHTMPYYPISLQRQGRDIPIVMPAILKNSIMTPCKIDDGNVVILTVSGRDLVSAMKENLSSFEGMQPAFGLCSTCMTILATLGHNMDLVRSELLSYFKEQPFLMILCAGEGTYAPNRPLTYANMSYNTAIFGRENNQISK